MMDTLDPTQTLISLLEGMLSPMWQRPSNTKIQKMLAQLREPFMRVRLMGDDGKMHDVTDEKLVRNGPGERIRAEGGRIRVADENEMRTFVARKLVEEAQEVLAALEDETAPLTQVVEELADVTEAIRGLRRVAHIRKDDIRAARRAKRLREGDFEQRFVWSRE
jgi:predicted house-cleaning noncanonical NTP pyrophosphatase (MazG superfamily)